MSFIRIQHMNFMFWLICCCISWQRICVYLFFIFLGDEFPTYSYTIMVHIIMYHVNLTCDQSLTLLVIYSQRKSSEIPMMGRTSSPQCDCLDAEAGISTLIYLHSINNIIRLWVMLEFVLTSGNSSFCRHINGKGSSHISVQFQSNATQRLRSPWGDKAEIASVWNPSVTSPHRISRHSCVLISSFVFRSIVHQLNKYSK